MMRATPRLGVSLRDLLPEEEAAAAKPVAARAAAPAKESAKPLLLVEKLVKEYPRQGATAVLGKLFGRKPPVEQEVFRAVDGISFTVGHGESVGLVGESGCGKSTTSMMVMRLIDAGTVAIFGFVMAYVWFKISDLITPIRVSKETELEGLDGPEMGVLGYPDFQLHSGQKLVE
jgi:ABC-type glutathione transport system ATPase component